MEVVRSRETTGVNHAQNYELQRHAGRSALSHAQTCGQHRCASHSRSGLEAADSTTHAASSLIPACRVFTSTFSGAARPMPATSDRHDEAKLPTDDALFRRCRPARDARADWRTGRSMESRSFCGLDVVIRRPPSQKIVRVGGAGQARRQGGTTRLPWRFLHRCRRVSEGHMACTEGRHVDWNRLRHKIEQGADFVVTQLFFKNSDYLALRDHLHGACVDVPIIPGILPVLSASQIKRFTSRALGGARRRRSGGDRRPRAAARDPIDAGDHNTRWRRSAGARPRTRESGSTR